MTHPVTTDMGAQAGSPNAAWSSDAKQVRGRFVSLSGRDIPETAKNL